MVSAALFACGILDWVEIRRNVVRLTARLPWCMPERSTIAIGNSEAGQRVRDRNKTLLLTNVIPQHDRSDGLVPIIRPARPLPFATYTLTNVRRRAKRLGR